MISDDLLLQVRKPGQYIGREWNLSRKDFERSPIRFALAFPDLYEVGMSNLGIRILYAILNNIPDVCCERFFAPGIDMENILRHNRRGILSLESHRGLAEFELIGFSLGYELNYTNVLNMLELGGIPLLSSERSGIFPLVIGGGPCVLNPEPMYEFFDLFLFGEAEEAIGEIIDVCRRAKNKSKGIKKQDLLIELSKVEGVYVPPLYQARYSPSGSLQEFGPKISGLSRKIKKRFVKDLDKAPYPVDWLIPYVSIIHDRLTLEIMRGCPNRCRFCQARSQYFPFRTRQVKNILELSRCLYRRTGYEELALGGLSVSDYPRIEEVLKSLLETFKENTVSVSLPSIKPKIILGGLSSLIATVKKTGLTFAPEAATEKLSKILNKDFNEKEFFQVMEEAYHYGYRHLKLYFMIGLPREGERDLDAIIDFSSRISALRRKIKNHPAEVSISINTLIPKPHTPFQWLAMEGQDAVRYKQGYLKSKLNNRQLKFSFHNRQMSFLEGVFSRGDRRLGRVILCAFKKGARFDAWSNYFAFDKWTDAFRECDIDPASYLRRREVGEKLPWDFLDIGVSRDALLEEYTKVIAMA